MKPVDLYSLKPQNTPVKSPPPPAVTAIKAGLHPMSKTVQILIGNNTKKDNG